MMYKIQTLNNISDVIHQSLTAERYLIAKEEPVPDGILVRSASMHDMDPVSYTHLDVYKRQAQFKVLVSAAGDGRRHPGWQARENQKQAAAENQQFAQFGSSMISRARAHWTLTSGF